MIHISTAKFKDLHIYTNIYQETKSLILINISKLLTHKYFKLLKRQNLLITIVVFLLQLNKQRFLFLNNFNWYFQDYLAYQLRIK